MTVRETLWQYRIAALQAVVLAIIVCMALLAGMAVMSA